MSMTDVPTAISPDEIRNYRRLTAEMIAPWADTLRRYARESPHTDLRSADSGRRDDESQPNRHNTLGNLLLRPTQYPTTLGTYFPDWLEGQGQTVPDGWLDRTAEPEPAAEVEPEQEPEEPEEPPIEIEPQTDESVADLLPELIDAADPRMRAVWANIVMMLKNEGNADYLEGHYARLVEKMHAPSPEELVKSGELKRVHRHTFQIYVDVETDSMTRPSDADVVTALRKLVKGKKTIPNINYYAHNHDWTAGTIEKKEKNA